MRPILVGELNPYGSNPFFALYPLPETSSGGRLQRLVLGLPRSRYLEITRRNLCTGKWSTRAARGAAVTLIQLFPPTEHKFVLLGSKVAGAFGVPFTPFSVQASTHPTDEMAYVVLPHPSGLNRLWSDHANFQRAQQLMGEQFPDIPFGTYTE